MAAIEIDGVTKRYGDVVAVRDLSFEVEEGEVFGFLGPNGAGKSTTINILLDFVRPTEGEVRVFGHDVHDESVTVREHLGVLPEGFSVYDRLTGRQHLEFAIESKDADDNPDEILERVGLSGGDGDRKAGGYSKGMAQRLVLGMALVGDPDLLVLDEPSTGLDPQGARQMRDIVREEAEKGTTVFFSSHILGQVESVCDRVGILRDGQLVAEDSIEGLRETTSADTVLHVTVGEVPDGALDEVRGIEGVMEASHSGSRLEISCESDVKTGVLSTLEDAGVEVEDFETDEASLEDLFMAYTTDKQEVKA
ncbi:ABC transporter ATP-binding protein [Halorussus lipolyticus]|uniref:ABC transporter ATP-binding protein n=1 Tax=Halorussus lipolyticus TaxID=3034024 RepID=UPI0023E84D8C|nr:ABC transporter ATP-binding protein [Halorussus sp. DT80]